MTETTKQVSFSEGQSVKIVVDKTGEEVEGVIVGFIIKLNNSYYELNPCAGIPWLDNGGTSVLEYTHVVAGQMPSAEKIISGKIKID